MTRLERLVFESLEDEIFEINKDLHEIKNKSDHHTLEDLKNRFDNWFSTTYQRNFNKITEILKALNEK